MPNRYVYRVNSVDGEFYIRSLSKAKKMFSDYSWRKVEDGYWIGIDPDGLVVRIAQYLVL
jgi:hypothetical protein